MNDNKRIYYIIKYCILLKYMIKTDSLFINDYKVKLIKHLLTINKEYSNLLLLNNKELLDAINKILIEYFKDASDYI